MDEEGLGQVQYKVVQSILKKWHVQSTLPTAIRHGPAEFGGLGIYDLRTEAGLEAIKFFRDSIYANPENGKLLRMNLRYSRLESGIGQPLLESIRGYICHTLLLHGSLRPKHWDNRNFVLNKCVMTFLAIQGRKSTVR